MARYAKIDRRMHADEKYRRLTRPQPCGQVLWWQLLAGKQTGIIPGLYAISEVAFAADLKWPLKGFRLAFAEVLREGMVEADWDAGLVWVPNAIRYNTPASPNVVTSWRDAWDELPECPLKSKARDFLKGIVEGFGKGYAEAFDKACPMTSGYSSVYPSPNQEQEQEQEQEKKKPPTPSRGASSEPCCYCGATAAQTGRAHQLDHFRPQAAGGTGGPSNLVLACSVCNQAKQGRLFDTVEECRRWLHHAYWSKNRQRWIAHRPFAFGGQPPEGIEPQASSSSGRRGESAEEKKAPNPLAGGRYAGGRCAGGRCEIPAALTGDDFARKWAEWKQYLREKRKTLVPSSERAQLEFLAGLGRTQAIERIELSIANGWTGIVFPDRRTSTGSTPPADAEDDDPPPVVTYLSPEQERAIFGNVSQPPPEAAP